MTALCQQAKQELYDDDVYEQIDGQEIMFARPSTAHIMVARNLTYILHNYLKGKRCQVLVEPDVFFDSENRFIPDLVIVCDRDKIKADGIHGTPDFVVEILSLSTQKRDLTVKKDTYEKFGVKEYWIVDPLVKTVTVFRLFDGTYNIENIYRAHTEAEIAELREDDRAALELKLKVSLYDDLIVDVGDIFEGLTNS